MLYGIAWLLASSTRETKSPRSRLAAAPALAWLLGRRSTLAVSAAAAMWIDFDTYMRTDVPLARTGRRLAAVRVRRRTTAG